MTNPERNAAASTAGGKLAYKSPTLTVFGSVRELTGGASNTGLADGGASMGEMKPTRP